MTAGADAGDGLWVGGDVPVSDLVGVQQPRAGDEQDDVVEGAFGQQGVDDCLAGLFRGTVRVGQGLPQEVQAGVEIAVAVLEEPVGEQGQ